MAITILNPNFSSLDSITCYNWTIGANNAWSPGLIAPDATTVDGFLVTPGAGNAISQTGVFPDYGVGTQHKIKVVCGGTIGTTRVAVLFGTVTAGTITAPGTYYFQASAATSDTLSFDITAGVANLQYAMAYDIGFAGKPDTFTPAYNPIYFYADSIKVNEEGFKYIVDLYSANTTTRMARYKLFPRPIDGLGVADINQILSTQLSYTLAPTINNWHIATDSWVSYDIKLGEEYVTPWLFYDNFFNSGAYVGFTGVTAQPFVVGDQVLIAQTTGGTNTYYNGVHNVISATTNSFTIDEFFGVSTPPEGGTANFADHRKTQFTGITSATAYTAWNGSIDHETFMSYNSGQYKLSAGTNASFLTSVPTNYKMKIGNDMWLNYAPSTSTYTDAKFLVVQTDDGNHFRYTNPSGATIASGSTVKMMQLAMGPNNLNNFAVTPTIVTGSIPAIKSTTSRYSAFTENSSSARTSQVYIFDIDTDCTGKYTNVQLLFLDRKGSWCPANFELRSTYEVAISREEYQKTLGNLDVSTERFKYDSTNRGRTNLNTVIKKKVNLTSNWMSETNATFLQELFTSPEVYIYEGSARSQKYWPVILTDPNYTFKTKLNDKLINYTCTLEYANNDRVQNF